MSIRVCKLERDDNRSQTTSLELGFVMSRRLRKGTAGEYFKKEESRDPEIIEGNILY